MKPGMDGVESTGTVAIPRANAGILSYAWQQSVLRRACIGPDGRVARSIFNQ